MRQAMNIVITKCDGCNKRIEDVNPFYSASGWNGNKVSFNGIDLCTQCSTKILMECAHFIPEQILIQHIKDCEKVQ
jgi:hypothetical protein